MVDSPISGLPDADLPLSGAEKTVIVQNGVTKQLAVEDLPQSGAQLNSNELAAVQNSNAPTAGNPFATATDISGKENSSNKVTNFSAPNNTTFPTTLAVSTEIASKVAGLLDLRGSYNASGNLFPSTGGSGAAGAILKGDFWVVSSGGNLGGVDVLVGQSFFASVDSPGQTSSNWEILPIGITSAILSIDTTVAGLATLITNSEITIGARYRITDATAGVIWVWGIDANVISTNAALEGDYDGTTFTVGDWGRYKLDADFFFPYSGRVAASPDVTDDETKGLVVGDVWLDTIRSVRSICKDNTTGAAVWQVQSGVRTPTLAFSGTDAIQSVALINAMFSVNGNIVTETIGIVFSANGSVATAGTVIWDLPIEAGAALNAADIIGTCQLQEFEPLIFSYNVRGNGDAVNGRFDLASIDSSYNSSNTVLITYSYKL